MSIPSSAKVQSYVTVPFVKIVGAAVSFVSADGTAVVAFVNDMLGDNVKVTLPSLGLSVIGTIVVVIGAGDVVVVVVGTLGVVGIEGSNPLNKSLMGELTGVITSSAWTSIITTGSSHTSHHQPTVATRSIEYIVVVLVVNVL